MNLAGYVRVSGEVQIEAYGKPVQIAAETIWAELHGHTITAFFEEDAVSGTIDGAERPVLADILARADELGIDGILFFDPSRIARRLLVQETLLVMCWAAGLRTFTTTADEMIEDDDPTRIMIRQILASVAEFDHRSTVKKLHAARKIKSSRGGYIGGTPKFGTAVLGAGRQSQFTQHDAEAGVITEIRSMYEAGASMRSIAESLNAQHIPTKRSGRWHAKQISRILERV